MSKALEDELENLKIASKEQDSVWAIQGEPKISKKLEQFIDDANEFIFIILTPDISASMKNLESVVDKLLEKRSKNPTILMKFAISITQEQKNLINKLFHANIEIYKWNAGTMMPFGFIMTENNFLQTYLNSINPKPKYDFGIFMENISEEKRIGLQHLCVWFYTYLCKKVVFTKKSRVDKEKSGSGSESISDSGSESDEDIFSDSQSSNGNSF